MILNPILTRKSFPQWFKIRVLTIIFILTTWYGGLFSSPLDKEVDSGNLKPDNKVKLLLKPANNRYTEYEYTLPLNGLGN